jgi:hypothetical protein
MQQRNSIEELSCYMLKLEEEKEPLDIWLNAKIPKEKYT